MNTKDYVPQDYHGKATNGQKAKQYSGAPGENFPFPADAEVFPVSGSCMEPFIRDGNTVIATRHDDKNIKPGTAVVIYTPSKILIKLWGSVHNEQAFLHFTNDDEGNPGTIVIPARDIVEVWLIRGVWLNDIPFKSNQRPKPYQIMTPEALERMVARECHAAAQARRAQ